MAGIYTTSVNAHTLDEAPMAYKSLEDITDVIHDSVDVIDIMKPIYNFNPLTRTVPNGKTYNRYQQKQEDYRSGRLSHGSDGNCRYSKIF